MTDIAIPLSRPASNNPNPAGACHREIPRIVRGAGMAAQAALAALAMAIPARANEFINGGFETNSFAGWTESGGIWLGGLLYPENYAFGAPPYQSEIVGTGDVPCLASRNVSVPQVRSGSYAVRLNSNDQYFPGPLAMRHFSQIQQDVPNWTSPYFIMDWSAVLQDSSHLRAARPHFRVILRNLTKGTTIHNVAYYSDDVTLGVWQRTGDSPQDWSYSNWRQLQINTPDMAGDTLQVTILASDCSETGHDASLYLDNIMGRPPTGNELPVAVPALPINRVRAGTQIMLNGSGSNDPENDPIDLYDWDFNGDGVPDLSSVQPMQLWTVPATWTPGTYTLNLRVRETLPLPLPAQWSPWAPVTLTVLGPPDAAHSMLSPATASITADGMHTTLITVQARDANNNNLTTGGETVLISLASGTGTLSGTTDNNNGTYTAMVTAPPVTGSGTFTATMGSAPVGMEVGAHQAVVTYVPGPLHHFGISAIASPQIAGIPVTGITLIAKDMANNTVTGFTGTVDLSETGDGAGGAVTPAQSSAFIAGVLPGLGVSLAKPGAAVTLTVTRTGGGETGTSNAFTVLDPYAEWLAGFTFPPDADLTPAGDADHDGMTNQQEFAFGLDPTAASSVAPITVTLDRTAGTFTYTRRDRALTGLAYKVFTSTDLRNWTEDTGASQVAGAPDPVSHVERVSVTLGAAKPLAAAALFVRVRAERAD